MRKSCNALGIRGKLFLSAAAIVAFAGPMAFSTAHAKPVQAQSQAQNTFANLSDFKFDVASIKPNKSGVEGFRFQNPPNGLSGTNVSPQMLIHYAFGIFEEYRYSGAPIWISTDRYDIETKLDSSTIDELQKLSKAQRQLAWQQMLQALLQERFHLTARRETKEFPVYFLVIAKNGPNLQESKPNPDDPNAPKNAVWGGSMKSGMIILPAKLMPMEQLASQLSGIVGRMVLDRTGLTGKYDFTLQYAPEQSALSSSGGASEGQPVPAASDPNGTSIFTALQEQLGLKLDSGKGPIEIIVIDHIERASGN